MKPSDSGRIIDLAAADYYADRIDDRPSLNASIAKVLLNESPRHAWFAHCRLNPNYERRDDAKFDVGTVVHRILLQPELESRVAVVEADSWRSKAAQAVRDQARIEGDTPLLVADYDRVMQMLSAVRDQIKRLDVDPLPFYAGKAVQTVVWSDERTGVLCRARLDWLHNDYRTVDDLKTSKWANPLGWARRTLWSIGADVQTAFYRRGVKAVTSVEPDLRFIVAETQPPFAVSVVALAESALTLADAKVDAALDIWKRCIETDCWPGYVSSVVEAAAPAWAEMDFWDRQELARDLPSDEDDA